jgi:hypothetical protein
LLITPVDKLLCGVLKTHFPEVLKQMQKVERDAGILPGKELGGKDGATASVIVSQGLGNTLHYDTLDASPGVATFTELYLLYRGYQRHLRLGSGLD